MDKVYLCGKCGKINEHGEDGLCSCGSDYWLEKEDLTNPDLKNYVKSIMKNLNLKYCDLFDIFYEETEAKKENYTLFDSLVIAFCIFLILGQIKCCLEFFHSDFKPSYNRELVYGLSFVAGIGGVVGWLNIDDSVEVEK